MPLDLLAAKLINCRNRRFVIHSDLTIFGRALNNYKGLAIKSFKQNGCRSACYSYIQPKH